MTEDRNNTEDRPANDGQAGPKPKFLDKPDARRVPLGKLRTDEEARLAAEIEKLRG